MTSQKLTPPREVQISEHVNGMQNISYKNQHVIPKGKEWDDPEVHGAISFRTLNIRIGLLEERLTAVLICNISVLSVIYT